MRDERTEEEIARRNTDLQDLITMLRSMGVAEYLTPSLSLKLYPNDQAIAKPPVMNDAVTPRPPDAAELALRLNAGEQDGPDPNKAKSSGP